MKSLKNLVIFCLALILAGSISISLATARSTQAYDIVIKGGRVIDPETKLDAVRDVGIKGDKIAAISESSLTGRRVIDARGSIVSPGFIDLHSHSLDLPGQRMQAFDGVTTALELESGGLPVAQWYGQQAQTGQSINYGISAAWTFARIAAMIPEKRKIEPTPEWYLDAFRYPRWTTDVTTPAEQTQVIATLEQGLKEGAIAIGVNAGYVPGVGGKELIAVSELAARYNVPTSTHLRDWSLVDPNSSVEGINMTIGLAATTGVESIVCHLNSTSLRDGAIAAKMLEKARAQGIKITTEAYPYGIGTFPVSSAILLQKQKDFKERIGVDFDRVRLIAKGRQIVDEADIRREQQANPGQFIVLEYLKETDPNELKILDTTVTLPWAAIASDAVPWNYPDGRIVTGNVWPLPENAASNPRSAGTFAKFLGRWVRERKTMSWADGIKKLTLIPAQTMENGVPIMKRKGRLQPGMDADITVFDPNTILDRATVDRSAQTSVGVQYLLVNGTVLIDDGKLDVKVKPGQPVRRNVT